MPFDIDRIRASFPSLFVTDDGQPRIYFDNPGGTQVPRQVIDRTSEYFTRWNTNSGGPFRTSIETDRILDEAHAAMADLVGAASPREIVFGQNMTSLTYAMSRTLGRRFRPGDRLLLTRMDHDANVAPWLQLARDLGLEIDWLPFSAESYRYEMDRLGDLVGERTVLAAVNHASNALGTINDVAAIARQVHAVGGLVYVDSVQYVPHGVTDVQALECDFLTCSAYKFFGPHQGILWGRRDLLQGLEAYKVRPADNTLPHRFETGTLSHEGMAGTLGAVEYLAWIGTGMAGADTGDRRAALVAGMSEIERYERALCVRLIDGLQRIGGVRIYGLTDAPADRVPTVVFSVEGLSPGEVNRALAAKNIFAWDGNYYALEVMTSLGLEDGGGLVRIGLAHYNTADEVDHLLDVLESLPA